MSTPTPAELSAFVKEKAASLGFALCGVTGTLPRRNPEFYDWWLGQGFAAGMHYLKTQKRRRKSFKALLPGAQSVIVLAMRFPGGPDSKPADAEQRAYGKVARYALHEDYHNTILPLLEQLALALDGAAGLKVSSLAYVDTGAISERAYASEAGLGWIGKHSLLINPEEGSWLWLGEVITTAKLALDSPIADHCGKCRRCVDACPTGAILEGLRAIDSRKCLPYWNIEHRGAIPQEFHKPMGDWLLGCDICQEVCPWTSHSLKKGRAEVGAPPVEYIAADEILSLGKEEFKAKYKGRALERAKLEGLQRNAAIVKENFEKK